MTKENKSERAEAATRTLLKQICEQGSSRGDLLLEYEEATPRSRAEYYSYAKVRKPSFPYRYREWLRKEPHRWSDMFDRGFQSIKKWIRSLNVEERHLAKNAVTRVKKSSRRVWIKSYGLNNWYKKTRRGAFYGWSSFIPYYEEVETHWSIVEVAKNEKGLFDKVFNVLRCEGVKLLRMSDLYEMITYLMPSVDNDSLKEDLEYLMADLGLCPHDIELWPAFEGHQSLKVSFRYNPYPFTTPAGFFRDYLTPVLEPNMSDKIETLEQTMMLCKKSVMNTIVLVFDLKTGRQGYAFRFSPEGWSTNRQIERDFVEGLIRKTKNHASTLRSLS